MSPSTFQAARTVPQQSTLLTMFVLRSERTSPAFVRVTLGGGDIESFVPMGFDQWFRLFIAVAEDSLDRLPNKLDTLSYARFLAISKSRRPILRNYTVRAFRPSGPGGPEMDVDFVVHGSVAEGTAGPAAAWAQNCRPGDAVAIIDEGIGFNAPDGAPVEIVGDASALPAVAGVLASLPREMRGRAFVEVPTRADEQPLEAPEGVSVTWVHSGDRAPGQALREHVESRPAATHGAYYWAVGESSLVTGLRRHWVRAGIPKSDIVFCGYWKH